MTSMTTSSSQRSARTLASLIVCLALVASACGAGSGDDDSADGGDGGGGQQQPTGPTATDPGFIAGPADGTDPVVGGNLRFGIEAEPAGLDPFRFAFSSSGHLVASAVLEPLAQLDENGEAVPYLAETIEPNDDFTAWTITVPEGVVFHDGAPLDAAAVAANLQAYKDSSITGSAFVNVDGVEVSGPNEVTVSFSKPMVRFPLVMTAQAGYMVSPAMIDDPSFALEPVGTGPYVFSSHVPDEQWTFTANPDYRIEGKPYLESIEYLPVPDNGDRLKALRDGGVDVMYTQRAQQVEEIRSSDFKRVEYAGGDETMFVLNTSKPPFDSLTARQAVATATDAATWREGNLEGEANSPFAPFQPGYLEENGYPTFDLERAKELVAQYEAETGQPLSFSFSTQEDVDNLNDADFFRSLYEEAGMQVEITAIPQVNLVATVATGAYELSRFRVFNQPDPDADSHFWRTASIGDFVSLNFPRYVNEDVDAAIDRALAATDEADQAAAYEEVNRIFAEDVPYIWLGRSLWVLAADPFVNGIYAAENGSMQTVGAKPWISDLWIGR